MKRLINPAWAMLALAPHGTWLLAFGLLFGLVGFATVYPTNVIATHHFVPSQLGVLFGLLPMVHQVRSALGSYVPGLLHDLTGSYTPTLFGCAAALLAATLVCVAVLPPRRDTAGTAPTTAAERRAPAVSGSVDG
ncbi:hypothetical protein ABZV31_11750 [Streptomyces sp. NPDC005202]|uniref:hypothetical protein n=1 Tax=Streptomyces sp. NPDC005202 TaxID=3157021 RepID=UPI0033A54601